MRALTADRNGAAALLRTTGFVSAPKVKHPRLSSFAKQPTPQMRPPPFAARRAASLVRP
jgi:hypothetical protein